MAETKPEFAVRGKVDWKAGALDDALQRLAKQKPSTRNTVAGDVGGKHAIRCVFVLYLGGTPSGKHRFEIPGRGVLDSGV